MSSYFSVQFLLFNLQFGFWYAYNSYLTMNWEKICNTCSQKTVKYRHTLLLHYYLLEKNFFPSVVILRLVLHFLEPRPSYRSSLNPNSLLCIIFGVQHQRFFFLLLYGYMPFTVLQHLVEPFSSSNYGSATVPILTLSALDLLRFLVW